MYLHVVQVIDLPSAHDSILIITLFKCNKIHEPRFEGSSMVFFSNSSSRCIGEDLEHELVINDNYINGLVDIFWNHA
jgi:hypothetical protein